MIEPIIRIDITGLPELRSLLARMPAILQSVTRDRDVLNGIGTVLYKSAITTLDQGGRPLYKPLAQSTINRRWKKEQTRAPGKRANRQGIVSNQPLKNTGTLRGSLGFAVEGDGLFLTSVDYLKYHQWDEGRTKARFPARPVWGLHEDDLADIGDIITDRIESII